MKVSDLREGMRNVTITVKVVEVSRPRRVYTRRGPQLVADALVEDETGQIKLSLWNRDIDRVKPGDTIEIKNGYVSTFRGELQLNVGFRGTLTVKESTL